VVVLEDHGPTAIEIQALLESSPDFRCAALCDSAEAATQHARRIKPDVVLADLCLQGAFRPDAISSIKHAASQARVLAITAFEDPDLILRALRAGADGYILKSDSSRPLLEAIRSILTDIPPISARVARRILRHFHDQGIEGDQCRVKNLTARQTQVLNLLHQGFSNPEIASKLGITRDGVKMHVRGILARLDVETRVEAAALYERNRSRGA